MKKTGSILSVMLFMEYDGYVHYDLKVSTERDLIVKDIRLETDYTPYASEYFMGTGF